MQLAFGYNNGIPDTVTTAWGARGIFDGFGLDIPGDRQVFDGPDKYNLMNYLNEALPMKKLRELATEMVMLDRPGRDSSEVVLFDDGVVIVKCNTQNSFGYLYLSAYFKE